MTQLSSAVQSECELSLSFEFGHLSFEEFLEAEVGGGGAL